MRILQKLARPALVVFFGLLMLSCGYLIQPNVDHRLVDLKPGKYHIDQNHTSVLFKINHLGLSTFVGRFNRVEANLDFDPAEPEHAVLSARIFIDSLDVNNAELAETLKGSDFFDVKKFPVATFVTRSVERKDNLQFVFKGSLELHGVSAPVDLVATFNGGADNLLTGKYTLGFTGMANIKRSVFGMDYLIPAVSDSVDIEVFAEFQH